MELEHACAQEEVPAVTLENTVVVDSLIQDIHEAAMYLALLDEFGYNNKTQSFLKASYETFSTVDFSQYSEEDMRAIIGNKLIELNKELDVAFEGWFKDALANIAYKLKSDSGVAGKLNSKLNSIKLMDADKVDRILNKKCGFRFYTPENMEKMINFMSKAVEMAKKNEEALADSKKLAIFRKANKDQVKDILQKLRAEADSVKETYKDFHTDAMTAKGKLEEEDDTPASYGWTHDKLISTLENWLQNGAGSFKALKLIRSNIEKWGYDYKTKPGVATNTNGDFYITLETEAFLKEEFKNIVVFIDEAIRLYQAIDGSLFRFCKKF